MILARRCGTQLVEAQQHVADMKRGRERTLAGHILVKMTDVGGEHDEAPARPDAHELKTCGMSARRMDRQPGRNLGVAIVEDDPTRIIEPHEPADILDLE